MYTQSCKEGKPLLGICLGMQLLLHKGTEDGDSLGLDLIPGEVNHFSLNANLKGFARTACRF